MTIQYHAGGRLTGLSTDTKPTALADHSIFHETDTGDDFTLLSGTWIKKSSQSTLEAVSVIIENVGAGTDPKLLSDSGAQFIDLIGGLRVSSGLIVQSGNFNITGATLINTGTITVPTATTTLIGTGITNQITDTEMTAHTSTKITITNKSQLNSAIAYTDNVNSFTGFAQNYGNSVLGIQNPAGSFKYTFISSALANNRNIILPLLIGNDTFVFEDHTQTLTNKTLAGMTLDDASNIVFGTTTGTKIGTGTTQKIGFFDTTPVVQPATVSDASGGTTIDAEARTAINTLLARMRALGLIDT